MSKYLKILVAALAAVALATPAVALTLDAKGLFLVSGIMSDNVRDADDDADDSTAAVEQRFRLMTTAALNDAVKAVIEIESDYRWGADGGTVRADNRDELEVRAAYLDFTAMDTNFKVGTQTFNLGGGFIINEQASGLNAKYRGLTLSYIKVTESSNTGNVAGKVTSSDSESLDRDYFGASYAIKAGDFTLTPEVGYLKMGGRTAYNYEPYVVVVDGENVTKFDYAEDMDVYFFGAGAKGQVDKINLQANLMFSSWDNDTRNTDGLGTAAQVKAVYVDGPTSFGLAAAYVGDEDAPGGEFVDLEGFNNWSEILSGGEFSNLAGAGISALDGAQARGAKLPGLYYSNYMYVKLNAGTRLFNEKSGIRAAYIYAEQAADPAEGVDALTFGHELDAYFDYAITKGLKWTTGGGYLFADDDLGPDDMWKLGTKLVYVF